MKRSFFVLLLLSLIACNKHNQEIVKDSEKKLSVTLTEYKSIFVKSGDLISKESMANLVKDFATQTVNPNIATKSPQSVKIVNIEPFEVLSKSQATNGISSSLYSIVAVNSQGDSISTLISADARLPIILAHTKLGKNLNAKETPESVNLLVDAALKSYQDKLDMTEALRDSIKTATLSRIASESSIPEVDLTLEKIKSIVSVRSEIGTKSALLKDPITSYSSFYVVNNYFPFLMTAWSQGMPYNRLMPQSCPDNWLWDYRFPIPSSAVAIAQILAFYQPNVTMNGVSMDWNYLTENKEIYEDSDYFGSYVQDPLLRRNMVAELMRGVIQNCNISYTCTGSSMTITPVKNYLSTFQITTGAETGFIWPAIRNSVSDFKPGLMYGQTEAGQGHFMVIDGGMLMKSDPTSPTDFHFVHVNMGHGETYNGYYLMGDQKLEPGFATFTKNWKLLPSITMNYTN